MLIGLSALCATGCGSTRSVIDRSVEFSVESVETVERVDSVLVATRDTLKEVTTVTVILREPQDRLSPPDTIRVSTVTDRTRASVRDRVKEVEVRSEIRVDTVYINENSEFRVERLEPVERVQSSKSSRGSIVQGLRWVFWIIVATGGLIITIPIIRQAHHR